MSDFFESILFWHVRSLRSRARRATQDLQDHYDAMNLAEVHSGPMLDMQLILEKRVHQAIADLDRWDPAAPKGFVAYLPLSIPEMDVLLEGLPADAMLALKIQDHRAALINMLEIKETLPS